MMPPGIPFRISREHADVIYILFAMFIDRSLAAAVAGGARRAPRDRAAQPSFEMAVVQCDCLTERHARAAILFFTFISSC
jgi:hypothetical protein